MALLEKLKEAIASQLDIDPEEVEPDSSFTDDLNADSLDLVELMMALEEEFDIEIPDDVAENFKTPAEVFHYLESLGIKE